MILDSYILYFHNLTDNINKLKIILSTLSNYKDISNYNNINIINIINNTKENIKEIEEMYLQNREINSRDDIDRAINENEEEEDRILNLQDISYMITIENEFNKSIISDKTSRRFSLYNDIYADHIYNIISSNTNPLGNYLNISINNFISNNSDNNILKYVLSLPLEILDDDPKSIKLIYTPLKNLNSSDISIVNDIDIDNNPANDDNNKNYSNSLISSLDIYSLLRPLIRQIKLLLNKSKDCLSMIYPELITTSRNSIIISLEKLLFNNIFHILYPIYQRCYFVEDRIFYRKVVYLQSRQFNKNDPFWRSISDRIKSRFNFDDTELNPVTTVYNFLNIFEKFNKFYENIQSCSTIFEKVNILLIVIKEISVDFSSKLSLHGTDNEGLNCDELIDAIVLLLIYVCPRFLISETQMICDLFDEQGMIGEKGFVITTLSCAIEFIVTMDLSMLNSLPRLNESICNLCAGNNNEMDHCSCFTVSSSNIKYYKSLSDLLKPIICSESDFELQKLRTPSITSDQSLATPISSSRSSSFSRSRRESCSFHVSSTLNSLPATPSTIHLHYIKMADESYIDLMKASDPSRLSIDGWELVSNTTKIATNNNSFLKIYRKAYPGSSIFAFKGEGLIKTNVQNIVKVLMDPRNRTHYDEMFSGCDVIEQINDHTKVILFKLKAKQWCRSINKEFLLLFSIRALPDGGYILPGKTVLHEKCPITNFRGKIFVGGWTLRPNKLNLNYTDVIYVAHMDLCENFIPNWLQNMINSKQPLIICALAELLEDEKIERITS